MTTQTDQISDRTIDRLATAGKITSIGFIVMSVLSALFGIALSLLG